MFMAVLGVCPVFYLALPFAMRGPIEHWYTYPRFATYLMISLLLIPTARLVRWEALALTPGLLAALAVDWAVIAHVRTTAPQMSQYLEIIDRFEPHTRMFPCDLNVSHEAFPIPPFGQLHGHAAAAKKLYNPHPFVEPNNPLQFRENRMLPVIWCWRPSDFTMENHGVYCDYVIVKGIAQDGVKVGPTSKGPNVRLVHEVGDWRLYRVDGRLPYP